MVAIIDFFSSAYCGLNICGAICTSTSPGSDVLGQSLGTELNQIPLHLALSFFLADSTGDAGRRLGFGPPTNIPSCLPVLPTQDDANLDPFIEMQYRHRAPGASPGHEKCRPIGKGDLVMGNGVYAFGGMGQWVPETFALFINEQFGETLYNRKCACRHQSTGANLKPSGVCLAGVGHYSFPGFIEIYLTCSSG